MRMKNAQGLQSVFMKRPALFVFIIGVLFVLSYLALSRVAVAAGNVQNPRLASIPANTALSLGAYNPPPLAGCKTPTQRIISQSRFTYDSVNNQMLMFGGGHASTPRTDVDVLDLNSSDLTWHSAYASTPVSEMIVANFDRENGNWTTTGHPMARHSYDAMPFAINTGELILVASVNSSPNCQEQWPDYQKYPGKFWHYNPKTKKWTASPAGRLWGKSGEPSSEYDPISGKIITVARDGIFTYDPVAKVSQKVVAYFRGKEIIHDQNMVYFPPNGKMYYIHNDGTVFEVTLDRSNFANSTIIKMTGVTGCPPMGIMPPLPGATGETGWAYDAVNHIIGGGIVNGLFYAFDPIRKTWTATTMGVSPATDTAKVGKLAFHTIDYDSVDDVFIFIAGVPRNDIGFIDYTTWAYRHGPAAPPVESVDACPSPPPPPPPPSGSGGSTPPPPPPIIVPSTSSPVGNGITITEQDDVTTDNYPIQIGRPFIQGEIPDFPVAIVNGAAIRTQADVKQRWSDGSVKHAIITFLIPRLVARQTASVIFGNQASAPNTPLSRDQMLGGGFDFDALMAFSGGVTGTASARIMLANGDFSYWLRGPVATSIILADHSVKRLYDMGSDANRTFRPIFHATFWPRIDKVHVRFIGEIANSEAFQDQTYALALTSPAGVYNKPAFTHYAGSRWTKDFWIGGAPSRIAINHNLAYLTQTKMLPNYDTSRVVPEATLAAAYTKWQVASKDLYDRGNWTKVMSGVGGRPDIGPYPTWTIRWLYSGDVRMQEQAFGNADLAAAWPMHFREGDPAKFLDRPKTVPGLGRILSISTRPTIDANSLTRTNTRPEDKINIVGPITDGGWKQDSAHAPDMFSPQYLLSGDYWYLEEMLFWSGWGAMDSAGPGVTIFNGRGPTGAEGGTAGRQTRSEAWKLRNRIEAASIAPDSFPEKQYFNTLTDDMIAIAEGQRGITGTPFTNNTNWKWGNTYSRLGSYILFGPRVGVWTDIGYSPLHWWIPIRDLDGHIDTDPADLNVSIYGISPWEQNFLIYSLGRAKELGHPTGPLISWLAINLVGQITDPGFNPYLSGMYKLPVIKRSTLNWFQSWADNLTGVTAIGNTNAQSIFERQVRDSNVLDGGFVYIAMAAGAMIANEPGGMVVWNWLFERVGQNNPRLDTNPKWAILPRATN